MHFCLTIASGIGLIFLFGQTTGRYILVEIDNSQDEFFCKKEQESCHPKMKGSCCKGLSCYERKCRSTVLNSFRKAAPEDEVDLKEKERNNKDTAQNSKVVSTKNAEEGGKQSRAGADTVPEAGRVAIPCNNPSDCRFEVGLFCNYVNYQCMHRSDHPRACESNDECGIQMVCCKDRIVGNYPQCSYGNECAQPIRPQGICKFEDGYINAPYTKVGISNNENECALLVQGKTPDAAGATFVKTSRNCYTSKHPKSPNTVVVDTGYRYCFFTGATFKLRTNKGCALTSGGTDYISGLGKIGRFSGDCQLECKKYAWCRGVLMGNSHCRLLTDGLPTIPGWLPFSRGNWAEPKDWKESGTAGFKCYERTDIYH